MLLSDARLPRKCTTRAEPTRLRSKSRPRSKPACAKSSPANRALLITLQAWIATGRHLDDDNEADAFCLAVLMNDLSAALTHADAANFQALPQILLWLEHHAPRGSYGSPAALGAWPRIARVHAGSKV